MKLNNNDEQHKVVSLLGKNVVVSLFILGYLHFNDSADFKLITKISVPKFPNQCGAVQNQSNQVHASSQNLASRLNLNRSKQTTCPSYFRWIHEDLRPWKETGITRDMVEKAGRTAHFRLLLRWYPGRLPDLELMFDADDRPIVRSDDFKGQNMDPPPLFRYCSDDASLDIVFPDWSFWGWAEINIEPWGKSLEAIKKGNNITQWKDRVAYAYWKGNPDVDPGEKRPSQV
ncbi:hypothetical protein F2Q69_00062349 [Brassica cretica]|uniref:Glycosyl transferase CAP10 domain-containing protein n=1 Tax=Brassica cretica TaxID=69181 RepID=A0A8S9RLN5_BRACR|nr:hypothetical protein F2Q69_00062349 [Brassica cretica]